MKHTKIVATLSDKNLSEAFVKDLFDAGMNVVRLNTAHLNESGLLKIVNTVRAVSDKIALLMDTKGPEIRSTIADNPVQLKIGQIIDVIADPTVKTDSTKIGIAYANFANDVPVGCHIMIDDGEIEMIVKSKSGNTLTCEVMNDGEMGSRKSINVPGVRINLPSLTQKDRENVLLAIKYNLDFIAHSFVRSAQDVKDIQDILDQHNSEIKIIAKIENHEGVENIDEILKAVYGIMVARGDLAIEIGQEKIPGVQRDLIRKCVLAKKPVIVATQMLHSMIKAPRPTRAEVTDIANAIYYRTDALMLSGETAYGAYPVESVKTMSAIAREAELTKLTANDIRIPYDDDDINPTAFLSKQAVKAGQKLATKAILTDSYTGETARNLAAFRGKNPVFAQCYKERTMRELSLSYGVFPTYLPVEKNDTNDYIRHLIDQLYESNLVEPKDLVAYLGGSFGVGNGTTFLEICEIGKLHDKH